MKRLLQRHRTEQTSLRRKISEKISLDLEVEANFDLAGVSQDKTKHRK